VQHRIFGSFTRLSIPFLSDESTGKVIRSGFEYPVRILQETIRSIYELTGGYPWVVQGYGSALVDLLNDERRIVATPFDVKYITEHIMLSNSQNFEFWWPVNQLGINEERFIERLFREYPNHNYVVIRDFFGSISSREKAAYMNAFKNLKYCEVIDSTQAGTLKIRGSLLKQWLKNQLKADNKLKISVFQAETGVEHEKTGIFINHENLLKSLEKISLTHGMKVPEGQGKVDWLSGILKKLLEEAKRRTSDVNYKVTIAFWSHPNEAQLLSAYFMNGFSPHQPENVKMENAVDFKLVDEIRRAQNQASLEDSRLGNVIIVSGEGDYVTMSRTLVNEGVNVQIWGGTFATNQNYAKIVGEDNVVALEDVCGL
jgi:hypothetical protein